MVMSQRGSAVSDVARLEDYLRAVQLRKWLVLTVTIVGLVLSYLYVVSRTDSYTATATVLIRSTPVGARVPGQNEPPNLEREREVIQSDTVAMAVGAGLEPPATAEKVLVGLTVDFRPESDVLQVHHTSNDVAYSAAVANAFVTEYADQREGEAVRYYESLQESTILDRDALTAAIEEVYAEREDLREERDIIADGDGSLTDIDAAIGAASASASSLSSQLRSTEVELRDLIKQDNARQRAAEVLKPALLPESPDGIGATYLLAFGLLLGLMGGMVTAFVLERLDTTAREDEDVSLALETSVLGSIPMLGLGARSGTGGLVMLSSGGSARVHAAREAFRRLRSSLQFLHLASGISTILVTSSTPGEGKSLICANLSTALAQNGDNVVLVNADMRRPTLERLLGVKGSGSGLSEYLSRTAELAPEPVAGIPNLAFVRSGSQPANPGELLNSTRFDQMLLTLKDAGYTYVIIDTPPVLSTADAVSAARSVDGVLVLVDTERTDTSDLLRVRGDLARSGSKIIGAVMNRTKFKRRGFFRRRDHYAY